MTLARSDELITVEQAFHALHYFLDARWRLVPQEELAIILGETAILKADGGPADPAAWSDFLEAVDRAHRDGPPRLEIVGRTGDTNS